MKKILILLIMVVNFNNLFSKTTPEKLNKDMDKLFNIVSQYQDIKINGELKTIDMRKLLQVTLMLESRYGLDNYNVKHAKTPFQIEKVTGEHYLKINPYLKEYIEDNIGRKIKWNRDNDSVYATYIIYLSKLRYHYDWLDKLYSKVDGNKDTEWYVYKIYWNSVKGASTYVKYKKRLIGLEEIKNG